MSNNFKKLAAASLAIVCAASMTGCADNGYVGTVNGIQIPNGLYIYFVADKGYNEAQSKITEEQADTIGTAEVTVFTETIEGKTASAWLKDYAVEQAKRYAAVETLFTDYGLSLSDEDIAAVNDSIDTLNRDFSEIASYYGISAEEMAQYYGINGTSYAEHYEKMGISMASLRSYTENLYKANAVFLHYYDTDGLTPVTDDEINSYLTDNFASVKMLKLSYTDYQGLLLSEESDIQGVKDLAQKYADRFNSTGDWLEIQYDYDLRQAQYDAWVDASDKYAEEHSSTAEASGSEEAAAAEPEAQSEPVEVTTAGTAEAAQGTAEAPTAEAPTAEAEAPAEQPASDTIFTKPVVKTDNAEYDAYVQAAIDAATAEKKESADDCDQIVSKENSNLDEKLTEYIWNAPADGKAALFEDESCIYVVVREDITTKETWKESQHKTLLHSMKDEAFDELLKGIYTGYAAQFDDYLINTKYAPEKIRNIGK